MVPVTAPEHEMKLLGEADLDAILQIETRCYSYPWTQGIFMDCLESGYDILGIREQNRLMGYAVIRQVLDEVHLLNLCVAPERRGQGVARGLLRSLLNAAREHGAVVISLEVRASNHAAKALYRSEGFREIAVRPDYYPESRGREDGHIMECHL